MEKRFFYDFSGKIFINADNQDNAEKLVTGISLEDYVLDGEITEIDENYIPTDLQQRQKQLGTPFHPLDDPEGYEEYKMRECRYREIFNDFLNCKFDKDQLMKRMTEAEQENIDAGDLVYSVLMIDLKSKREKTAKLVPVN
jgi:hypothetical protein